MRWLQRGRLAPLDLGRIGERRAVWFYRLRGYRVVARNLRLRHGEVDLVVQRGKTLVIVEVKARQTATAGAGHDAVDRRKRDRLIRLGDDCIGRFAAGGATMLRYDIISIHWNGWRCILSHFPDAFRADSDPRRPWLLKSSV